MVYRLRGTMYPGCRSPCGERGLKSFVERLQRNDYGRSPCGERGLKWQYLQSVLRRMPVAPRAGSVD